jgi:sugar phosphate isomerase/epimerase
MIQPGLCSVTFRQLTPAQVIRIAADAGLAGIHWGADVHVPAGNSALARELRTRMDDHGLVCPTYGTYYRVGAEGNAPFESLLETAELLGARGLRIWVGNQGSAEISAAALLDVRRDLDRILALAAARDMTLVMEFHGGTITDTAESTVALLENVSHPALRTAWQPDLHHDHGQCLRSLELLLPWLDEVHVFQWRMRGDEIERLPLKDGSGEWPEYLRLAATAPQALWACLEFVRDNDPVNLPSDAAALHQWLAEVSNRRAHV